MSRHVMLTYIAFKYITHRMYACNVLCVSSCAVRAFILTTYWLGLCLGVRCDKIYGWSPRRWRVHGEFDRSGSWTLTLLARDHICSRWPYFWKLFLHLIPVFLASIIEFSHEVITEDGGLVQRVAFFKESPIVVYMRLRSDQSVENNSLGFSSNMVCVAFRRWHALLTAEWRIRPWRVRCKVWQHTTRHIQKLYCILHDEKSMKCYVTGVIRTAFREIGMAVWMWRVEEYHLETYNEGFWVSLKDYGREVLFVRL